MQNHHELAGAAINWQSFKFDEASGAGAFVS
jgi:hypothetical protein